MSNQDLSDAIDEFLASTSELEGDSEVKGADFIDKVSRLRADLRLALQRSKGWLDGNVIDLSATFHLADGAVHKHEVGNDDLHAWWSSNRKMLADGVDLQIIINKRLTRTTYLTSAQWRDLMFAAGLQDPLLTVLAYCRNGHGLEDAVALASSLLGRND